MRYGFLVLLVACDGPATKETGELPEGPELTHTPPATPTEGDAVVFTVTAVDPDGIGPVTLYHRVEGDTNWVLTPMDAAGGDDFSATLEAEEVAAPGIEYYFKAEDAGDSPAYTYLPAESTSAPYTLDVSVIGATLPYEQGFEYTDTETTLSDIGWSNATLGFRGYGWDASVANAYEGTQSAYHSRGHTGIDAMEDWLISPALDFSTVGSAQVTWQERGVNVDAATHGLWVSTGSRDPSSGDYVAVAERLPAPAEGAWGRSAVYDLSAYTGSSAVYLAWRFQGDDSDDWFLDDVRVEELQADLALSTSITPSPIGPGDSGTLTVTLDNAGAVDASDLTVTVTFPSGGASVAEASMPVASVGAGGTASADFSLTVDPTTPDNSYVPLTVTVANADTTWSADDSLLVGLASSADIAYTPSGAGSVEMVLGVGDPDAPSWEETVYSGDATDPIAVSLDITDAFALLPPTAGDLRWFLKVTPEVDGQLDAFTITYGGDTYEATVLPAVDAGVEAVAWLPEPPDFSVVARTVPSQLAPGDVGAAVSLLVTNAGADTQGPVTATLSSTDPDVTVTDPGPIALTTDVLAGGASANVSGVFGFDVAGTHTDSTDVQLDLLLDDGVESWTVPVSFAVPFPYLRVSDVVIDDDGGDGILDPGESAEITLEVTNVGDLATASDLDASLVAEATSTAATIVSTNVETYRTLAAGRSDSPNDPFLVTVDGGADGDSVDLLLTLVDSARSYDVRTTLTLGEPPWRSIDPQDDPTGDALDGWDFDLVNGSYRVLDGVLQIRLTSATVFDPDHLFVEAWGESTIADWTFYRIVLQSGVVSLQGYDSGFVDISTPIVSYPSPTEVQFDLTLADMGLALDAISFGFATGWCGPDEYYCDHYPDGWGYPYDTWNPSLFYELSW